jgi:hypothetical protein
MGLNPSHELSPTTKAFQLNYIRPYHREIARRLVLGQTQMDICRDLQMNPGRMSIIVNSPLFKVELRRLEALRDQGVYDMARTLQELAPEALEQVTRTMYRGNTERLRFDAAESVLDRAGFGRGSKVDVNVSGHVDHSAMTVEELRKLVQQRIQRMAESEQLDRDAIDASSFLEIGFDDLTEAEGLVSPTQSSSTQLEGGDGFRDESIQFDYIESALNEFCPDDGHEED